MKQSKKWDEIFLNMALVMATASHCVSRKVCAIIVKDRRIISTGINGTAAGCPNCDEIFPDKDSPDFDRKKHHEFSTKNEIHAEMNAIFFNARYGGQALDGATIYCTLQPCDECLKNILQTGIRRIVYANSYDFSDYSPEVLAALKLKNIELLHLPIKQK